MLRFFRTLRQRLLAENSVSRYLFYALGEIALVVIGILIAFQVDSWNEERKNSQLRDDYIRALVVDVETDIENLQAWKLGNDNAEAEGLYLLDFLENRMVAPDSQRLARSFLMCQYKPAITISSSTYSDLTNSGNIRVFKDLDFKKHLDEYYKIDAWSTKIDERITQTIWYDYRDQITEFIDPTLFKAIYSAALNSTEMEQLDLLAYEIDWKAIRQSQELLRQLRNVLAFRVVIRGDLSAHLTEAERLLETLKPELP